MTNKEEGGGEGEEEEINQESIIRYVLNQKKLSLFLSPQYYLYPIDGDDDNNNNDNTNGGDEEKNNRDDSIWCHLVKNRSLVTSVHSNSSKNVSPPSISSVADDLEETDRYSPGAISPSSSQTSALTLDMTNQSIQLESIDFINENENEHQQPQQEQQETQIFVDNDNTLEIVNTPPKTTQTTTKNQEKENIQPNIVNNNNNNNNNTKPIIEEDQSAQPFRNLFLNQQNNNNHKLTNNSSNNIPTTTTTTTTTTISNINNNDEWTNEEMKKLNVGCLVTNSMDIHYWERVSKIVGTKNASQCQIKWTSKFQTPSKEKKKKFDKQQDKEISPLNIEKKININTIKIKRKARDYLEKNTKTKKTKDIFDTTPFKKQHETIKIKSKINMDDDDDDDIDGLFGNAPPPPPHPKSSTTMKNQSTVASTEDQSSEDYSSSMISFKDIDKEQLDGYIHKLSTQMVKSRKKEIKSNTVNNNKTTKSDQERKKPSSIYKPMAEDQKKATKLIGKISSGMEKRRERLDNPESDGEEEAEYYYSEDEEQDTTLTCMSVCLSVCLSHTLGTTTTTTLSL
ncbi:hypothetical protein DFA_10119 [Cavenderia fasciculata]|uniref:Myb-like domain-containing protein n=1 Tax=Cavenderia fasciculata TaxID=261658 RepID=F4Q9B6_CACFS|nr:uncharacterized protein DFA_10119 [Cavenderia fasciculata]EGG15285.1 hypothetical protein DFA_10119 [Cavenderia fasciculata]|eukprot:XP_004352005.1 hypothetical protein DFA_10119 [Cavenderia fasciculata]